ncbi:MAG: fibrobacter succinogenes major paralogous domain-containing protein [Bacteroidales bacterium]|nr:fibrobacter succinogenes major paralogous domain-containing protein [Bacteroidales bacterium]
MKNLLAFLSLALLFSACGTVRDCDGNRYRTVKLNGMHWMAENLRTTHYADGSPIPKGDATTRDTIGAYYFDYGNRKDSVRKYGLLYTWKAAVRETDSASADVQGVCPDGWHLPDDAEWTAMTQGCAAERSLHRVPVSSQNMRIMKRFVRPPRGGYFYKDAYANVGEGSFWWSASPFEDGTAIGRYIDDISYPCPYVCFGKVCNGYSVRCVKDGAKITTPKTKRQKRKKSSQ